jgi:hypothetical protein
MGETSEITGTKVPAQFVEALRAGGDESASADFHVLRRGFIPDGSSETSESASATAGTKVPAQFVEALRADEQRRVGFSRLS